MLAMPTIYTHGIRNEQEYQLFETCEDYADYLMTLAPYTLDTFAEVQSECTIRAYRYYERLGRNAMQLYHRIYSPVSL